MYDAILIQGAQGQKLRPTLYDFLAHRAIDFFGQSESALTQPADPFLLREAVYFTPAETFAAHCITTTDSLKFTFQAVHLLQDLLQFRLNDNNLPALVEVNLKRLDFVYRQSVHPQKETLYRKALEALESTYAQKEVSAEVSYQMALQLYSASQQYQPLQSEQHQWEAKQAYERCATTIQRFPNSIGAQDCRSLQAIIQTKHIEITLEKINLPNEYLRGLVSFKNVGKLFVRVVKTNEEEFRKIHGKNNSYPDDAYREKLIRYYAAQEPVHQFNLTLPNAGDYQQHAAEFRIPALPVGDYILLQWLTVEPGQKLLDIPLTEAFRGNIGVHYTFVHQNRLYKNQTTVVVPYTNKELNVTFETLRNKLLPGEKETWKIRIRGKKGEKVATEMVATLYDASLDAFRANNFAFDIYQTCYAALDWSSPGGFDKTEATLHHVSWNHSIKGYPKNYDYLNWFGYGAYHYGRRLVGKSARRVAAGAPGAAPMKRVRKEEVEQEATSDTAVYSYVAEGSAALNERGKDKDKPEDKPAPEEPVKARTHFQETAFFYPHLQTDANGDVLVSFTIPEALTRWKMLGFAHTQDLQYGLATNTLVTQKELMITSNAPRFFREGDAMAFTAKVANLSEQDLSGTAQLLLFDALTMKPVDTTFGNPQTSQPFTVKKGQSSGLSWQLRIPEGLEAVTYRVVAKAGSHSDGGEMPVPILTNRLLVTETLPLPIRGNQTKTFQLDKLVNHQSATLRNHRLTLEFTANPAWYAVQALPYLMEYPYECAEQNFSRFYANSLASHIANVHPKIKRVFESWKNPDSKALVSNLEKNLELKALLLEETPWVLDARDESERKQRVAMLFDLNRMASEQERALTKLA